MRDLRIALRTLRARPGFAALVLLTVALGVGATTAVFTVLHAVLLAPLPYASPDQVVVLNERTAEIPILSATRSNYEAWRERARAFSAMGAFHTLQMTLSGAGEPERLPVKRISASLLPLLGVAVETGRAFVDADDRPGARGVAVLSAGFAARRYPDGAPLGGVLVLDHEPYTIVGVLPPSFELFQPADVYVPIGPWLAGLPDDRGWHPGIWPMARLRDGVTLAQAREEMDAIALQLEQEFPDSNRGIGVLVNRAQDQMVQPARPALLMLFAAVALVLLIACANVANLLLARAVGRQKEIAVRITLGAGRRRIVRQLVVESLALALLGGLAGFLLAWWGVAVLGVSGAAAAALPRAARIGVAWPVAWFTFGVSLLSGLLFGLAPALQATGVDILGPLHEEGRGVSASLRHRQMRAALVVAEIALALVLLVNAGLVIRGFAALTRVPPGFDAGNLLLVNLPLSGRTYPDGAARRAVVDRIVRRAAALPGATGAALTTGVPMSGSGMMIHFNRLSKPPRGPSDYLMTGYRVVTPQYLPLLRVPILRGRMLREGDTADAPPVVVVNEVMARQFFPGQDPVGQRIQLGTIPEDGYPAMEIVGVAADVRQGFAEGAKPEMFVPYAQAAHDPVLGAQYLNLILVIRTAADPRGLVPPLRAALREIDPGQPLVNLRTMEAAFAGTVAQPRLQMVLLVLFATLAVALAVVGVYGVMAYTVSQRIPEIGIRMAVGASPGRVVAMVVWEGARLALAGIGLGLLGAIFTARILERLVFPIPSRDAVTFAAAAAALAAAALLASCVPALRAARVSPFAAINT